MRIAVYGAGGVGGYFGGRLAQAGADVHLIARGAHLQALREHGLRVRSVKGDFAVRVPATDDPAEVGPCDYVLFCVKAFDTEPAAARLGPLVGDATAVVSLQNGVDNEEKLALAVGQDHVMGGAAFIFAGIAEPGVIVHSGGPTSITFGELNGQVTDRAQRLLDCCQRAGFAAELSPSIKTVLWAKLTFICAQAGMTAAVRLPIGEIRMVHAAWAAFQRLVAEVAAVAAADGTPVPPAARNGPWPWHRAWSRAASPLCTTTWWLGGAWSWRPCTAWWYGGRPGMACPCRCRRRSTRSSSRGRSATSEPGGEPTCRAGPAAPGRGPPRAGRQRRRGHAGGAVWRLGGGSPCRGARYPTAQPGRAAFRPGRPAAGRRLAAGRAGAPAGPAPQPAAADPARRSAVHPVPGHVQRRPALD